MTSEIPKDPVRSIERSSDPHVGQPHTSSLGDSSPAGNPGASATIDPKNVNMAEKKEGITLGKVGKSIARGLAGAVGGPLYATSFLVGAGLSLAVAVPMLAIAVPPTLLGAGIGALTGKPLTNTKIGAKIGAFVGKHLSLATWGLVESVLMLPKALIFNTAGRLGAGLCAFAATGKREAKQLKGDKFAVSKKKIPDGTTLFGIRQKSTHEKLLDALFVVSLPKLAYEDKNILNSTKEV